MTLSFITKPEAKRREMDKTIHLGALFTTSPVIYKAGRHRSLVCLAKNRDGSEYILGTLNLRSRFPPQGSFWIEAQYLADWISMGLMTQVGNIKDSALLRSIPWSEIIRPIVLARYRKKPWSVLVFADQSKTLPALYNPYAMGHPAYSQVVKENGYRS